MLGHARRIPLLALETESLENNYNDVLSARSTISAPSFKLFLSVCCYCGGRCDVSRCLKIRLESSISSSDFGRLRPRWPLSCWNFSCSCQRMEAASIQITSMDVLHPFEVKFARGRCVARDSSDRNNS